jgi:hypothetical protein
MLTLHALPQVHASQRYRSSWRHSDLTPSTADAASLESAPCIVWDIDEVGKSFYDCSENAKGVPAKLKAGA